MSSDPMQSESQQKCDPDFTKYDLGSKYIVPLEQIKNPFRTREKKTKEIPIHTIFITNIQFSMPPQEFEEWANQFGETQSIITKMIRKKGIAFVRYYDIRDAVNAIGKGHGTMYKERPFKVNFAFQPPEYSKPDPFEYCSSVKIIPESNSTLTYRDLLPFLSTFGEIRELFPDQIDGNNVFICRYFNIKSANKICHSGPLSFRGETFQAEIYPNDDRGIDKEIVYNAIGHHVPDLEKSRNKHHDDQRYDNFQSSRFPFPMPFPPGFMGSPPFDGLMPPGFTPMPFPAQRIDSNSGSMNPGLMNFMMNNMPMKNMPMNNGPMNNMPMNNGPMNNMPMNNIPMNNGPMNNMPMNNMPMNNGPMNNGPMNNGPMNNMPINNMPMNNGPMNNGPMNNGPMNNMSLNNGPMNNMPMNNGPMNNMPLNNGPMNNMPMNNMPLNNGPMNNMPLNNGPMNNIPMNNMPLNNGPMNNMPLNSISMNNEKPMSNISDIMNKYNPPPNSDSNQKDPVQNQLDIMASIMSNIEKKSNK